MEPLPQTILDFASKISSQISEGHDLFFVKDLIQNYDFSSVNFGALAVYDPINYKRTLLYTDEYIDIYLIGWNKRQGSKIHDHPDNGCVMRVLMNELYEETYLIKKDGLERLCIKKFNVGETGHIKKSTILHRIFNETDESSLSLHIYSPPNYKTKYYNEDGKSLT